MNSDYRTTSNYLDYYRRLRGVDACRSMFGQTIKNRRQNAVGLINDSGMSFTTLFILRPEIEEHNLQDELNDRNQTALNICKKISEGKKLSGASSNYISLSSEEVHKVLLWMFNTGTFDDGLSDEFDQILDIVASILMKTHHEKTILPVMTDMIFRRNKKGLFIHDLVWVSFQTRDPDALRYIAKYLRSSDSKDVELARTLLHLPQDIPLRTNADKQKQYSDYLSWLKENEPYLRYTGESFQSTNSPNHFNVDLESKYLCKGSCPKTSKQGYQWTNAERSCLNDFNKLPESDKVHLAALSQKLHSENPESWEQWLQHPVDMQLQNSGNNGGKSHDCHCR